MNRLHYLLYIVCTIKYSQLLFVFLYISKSEKVREGAIAKIVRLNAKKKIYAVIFPCHKAQGRIKLN